MVPVASPAATSLAPVACSEELLAAYKSDGDPEPYLTTLAEYDDAALARVRTERDAALAFWLNLYNAGTQRLLTDRPDLYESSLRFVRFFGSPALTVAGQSLSLDDIEHGLLRRATKYGLGYLPRFVPDTFEIRHRVTECDPRIHFALNCGAESCPAIRAYTPDAIDAQLDRATRAYLGASVEYDPEEDLVSVPRVMAWYRGDFGGRRGIRNFLRENDILPPAARPSIRYRDWDWAAAPGKFVTE